LSAFATLLVLLIAAAWSLRALWPLLARPDRSEVASTSHAHLGPTIEQVRGLASLTVLKVEVADVQVSERSGYTGGAKTVLVVKGDLALSTDLSRARFASQDSMRRTAVLVLSPPVVTSPRVDHDRTRIVCVWEYGLWRIARGDSARATLIDRAYAEAQAVVAAAGQDPSLDARARVQAETVLVAFFQSLGWTLTVRWSDRERGSGRGRFVTRSEVRSWPVIRPSPPVTCCSP
jgi:hypothetical protein